MIEAKHSRWANYIFDLYIMRLLKRHFFGFHLLGKLPETDPTIPILLIPNHNTWWDGFLVYLLNKTVLHRKLYLMMLEEQLSKYRFFSRVGAYSVNPHSPKSTLGSLKYTLELLQRDKSMVCIFPQGELKPWHVHPIKLKRGIDWIFRNLDHPVNILPLAMRIEFLNQQRPDVFFLPGENYIIQSNTFQGKQWLENIMENLLTEIDTLISSGAEGRLLLSGGQSINERWGSLRTR